MSEISRSQTIAAGLAMFCMFFGAGNVVYPLVLGQYAQDKNIFAIIGMLITAVGVPFLGVIAIVLFDGDHRSFFGRMGKIPGFLTAAIIMALIGPFGAIPRCIALSYATVSSHISLPLFSFLTCLFIFAFTIKKSSIVDTLGYFFTPFLLLSLGIIIFKGLLFSDEAPVSLHSDLTAFLLGLKQGYQTMDLLGAFFFSSVVLVGLKACLPEDQQGNYSVILKACLKASVIGAFLLAIIYVGFSYVAAMHSAHLEEVKSEDLINQIAHLVLGDHAGILVSIAVSLACVTTAIALSAVFAEYLQEDITNYKMSYPIALVITLIIAGFISTLNFSVIIAGLAPILEICYPALIVLCIANILHKLYGFQWVKTPVFATLAVSLINAFYPIF